MNQIAQQPVIASPVRGEDRLNFFQKYLDIKMALRFENSVFNTYGYLNSQYHGGYWEFLELDNGGFFMMPPSKKENIRLSNPCNYAEVEVSAMAAGVITTLIVLSSLAIKHTSDSLSELYHKLYDFAEQLCEFPEIARVLD